MRRLLSVLGALGVVLSLVVGSASGLARPQTFSLLEVDETDASTNLGFDFQRFPRPGDQFGFKSALYRWDGHKRGARIGRDIGTCTFIRVPANEQHFSADGLCSASAFLPGGQIHVQGVVRFTEGPSRFDLPVI